MRVGLVLEEFDPRRGGLEQWTWQFARQLVRRGHEVHVVAGRFPVAAAGLPVVAHPLENGRSRLAFARAAERALRSLGLDVIHDMGSGWYCDVLQPHGGSWTSVTERKLLLSPPWLRPIKRRLDRLLPRQRAFRALLARQYAAGAHLFVALSRTVAGDLERYHHVPRGQIRIVYNGVDADRFSPHHRDRHRAAMRRQLGVSERTVLLLIVAHNFRLKGVPTLLRAVSRLVASGRQVHLAVVGGKRLGPWERKAKRMGIGPQVTFAGQVEDAVPYYAAADLYVHPTFYDPCSLVLLEAAASGLPIVTTNRANGVAELLEENAEALYVSDPASDRELAERIDILLDASLRRAMGEAARHKVLRHTLDRNVDEMLAVYEEAASGRYRRAA